MINKKLIISLLISAAGLLIHSGCSASSTSERYGKNSQNNESKADELRYSTNKESSLSSTADSLSYDASLDEEEFDEEPTEELTIDYAEVLKRISPSSENLNADLGNIREKMVMEVIKYLNTPYKYGGNTKKGIDCSAFTKAVYESSLSLPLDRSAREQFNQGLAVNDRSDLKFGDLVFFNTTRRVRPGHVGIYLGENLFAHASRKLGVTISSLEENYYHKRYMGGRRLDSVFETE
ncbi:MAG: NlpC/P60 family protein [Ignavibacteria bacterium]|nr:NlpC/P60 family protein [Ignavibacteria bacterium]